MVRGRVPVQKLHKSGFTLIELLIVTVVVVTLASIVFRLTNLGGNETSRAKTVRRLQRLENCLSGYYAAFGTYPPVRLHGSRDIYVEVGSHFVQKDDNSRNDTWAREGENYNRMWQQVDAACKSQPVGVAFPFPTRYSDEIDKLSEQVKGLVNSEAYAQLNLTEEQKAALTAGFDDGVSGDVGRHDASSGDWRDVQLFKFGLMSYLLPRYMYMMSFDCASGQFNIGSYKQWTDDNKLPANAAVDGEPYDSWNALKDDVGNDTAGGHDKRWRVELIPSQAACSRWMVNLRNEKNDIMIKGAKRKFFGVEVGDKSGSGLPDPEYPASIVNRLFAPNSDSTSQQYILDRLTAVDGWDNEFYYYSPPPYQSYRIWSAGRNGKTFPPWIDIDQLEGRGLGAAEIRRIASEWKADDIVQLSN